MGDLPPHLLLGAFLIAAVTTSLLTPLVARLARRLGAVSQPGGRHMHARPTPRLGGVAVFGGLAVGASAYGFTYGFDRFYDLMTGSAGVPFLLPCFLVFFVGLLDDLRGLSPASRLAVEAVAAAFLIQDGYVIAVVATPWEPDLALGPFAFPITLAWFLVITNAFNLIDGLDGLLSSVAVTVLIGCAVVGLLGGRVATVTAVLAFAGALLGFLPWNWHQARVFLGDSGSLVIGFAIAAFVLKVAQNGAGAISLHVAAVLCALPVAETALTLARRYVNGQPYFSGDKSHLHHILVQRGLTVERAVVTLTLASALFVGAAILSRYWRVSYGLVATVALVLGALYSLRWVGYVEFRVLWDRIRHNLFRRRRKGLPALLAVARAGERLEHASSLADLRDRLRAAASDGGFTYLAIELDPTLRAALGPEATCLEPENGPALEYLAGREAAANWLLSEPEPEEADDSGEWAGATTASVRYTLPFVLDRPEDGGAFRLVCHLRQSLDLPAPSEQYVAKHLGVPLLAAFERLAPTPDDPIAHVQVPEPRA